MLNNILDLERFVNGIQLPPDERTSILGALSRIRHHFKKGVKARNFTHDRIGELISQIAILSKDWIDQELSYKQLLEIKACILVLRGLIQIDEEFKIVVNEVEFTVAEAQDILRSLYSSNDDQPFFGLSTRRIEDTNTWLQSAYYMMQMVEAFDIIEEIKNVDYRALTPEDKEKFESKLTLVALLETRVFRSFKYFTTTVGDVDHREIHNEAVEIHEKYQIYVPWWNTALDDSEVFSAIDIKETTIQEVETTSEELVRT